MPLPTELFAPRQLITDPVERSTYETDAGPDRALPDGVVFVESAAEVARLVAWAGGEGVPLVARGAGTGLAGGAVAERGGLIVAFTRMNRVLEIDLLGKLAVVDAGAVNLALDRRAAQEGLYYPPDPASGQSSLLGGNLATNAGGPHCFKYGVTTNYVQGLEVVLASGERATLGGRAADVPELDLAGLVVGSEGTLALITAAYLRLRCRPPAVRTLMAAFDSLETAGDAVSAVIAAGLVPATLEAIDQKAMRMIEEFCQAGLPADRGAVLIVDLDGYEEGLAAQVETLANLMRQQGALEIRIAKDEDERQRIWHGRKNAAGAMSRIAPNYYLTDITVRRSRLASVLARVHEICAHHDLQTASFFHAGDGNLHPLIPCDERDRAMMRRVARALDEIIEVCLAEGGSISGEHGVGIEKREQMARMHSAAELEAMRQVKQAFDPDSLLNPGKVLPPRLDRAERQPPVLPEGPVFVPRSSEEAASGLHALSRSATPARIIARDTPNPRQDREVLVSTAGLRGVVEFAPQDLFLTVGAGTPVSELDEILRSHELLAPIAGPRQMNLGALVATNTNAPLRMRYGGLRDQVLAVEVAMADGRVLSAGRPLVKNVAGYDLPKVFVGSHGSLGLVTRITLKLVPAPQTRRTLAVRVSGPGNAIALARSVIGRTFLASGLVLEPDRSGSTLLYTAEGPAAEVAVEIAAVEGAWRQATDEPVAEVESSATQAWCRWLDAAGEDDLVVRAATAPKHLDRYLAALPRAEAERLLIDCATGLLWARRPLPEPREAKDWLLALRRPALELEGYAAVIRMPEALRGELDPSGYRPSARAVMRRLRKLWDPNEVLADRFLFARVDSRTGP